ncbi:MAG TPA: glycoside hydrolase family 16 protein [Micromonosporaceae bacterium]
MPETPRTRRARRRFLVAVAAALPLATALFALPMGANATVPAPPAGWTTVFSDDFNGTAGTAPSSANWIYDLGTSYPGGAGNWGTGEVESETNSTSNVFLDGSGHLEIKPIKAANGSWTSGRIETARTDFAAPAGGQMELTASIEQPNPGTGLGYWPAFWAMGAAARPVGATNWPSIGELDVMEDVNGLSNVSHTFHCGVDPGGPCNETTGIGSGLLGCSGCQTGYHTYSVIVDRTNTSAEQLRFYTDGALQLTVNESQVGTATWQAAVDHGFFAILNVAIGGAYPNAICGCSSPSASTSSGAAMSVDYVSVMTTGGGSTPPPTTPPPTTPPPTTPPPTSPPPGGGVGATGTIQAEAFNAQSGTQTEASSDTGGGQDVGWIANGDWLQFNNVNFGSSGLSQFKARVASGATGGASGLVEVHLDSLTNPSIGSFAVGNTGGWQTWTTVPANITRTTGTHTVYLEFKSGQPADFVNVNWFTFAT